MRGRRGGIRVITIYILREAEEVVLFFGELGKGDMAGVRLCLESHVSPPGVEQPHKSRVFAKGIRSGQ